MSNLDNYNQIPGSLNPVPLGGMTAIEEHLNRINSTVASMSTVSTSLSNYNVTPVDLVSRSKENKMTFDPNDFITDDNGDDEETETAPVIETTTTQASTFYMNLQMLDKQGKLGLCIGNADTEFSMTIHDTLFTTGELFTNLQDFRWSET